MLLKPYYTLIVIIKYVPTNDRYLLIYKLCVFVLNNLIS